MTIIWQMLFLQGLGCLLQSAPRRAGILGAEDSSSLTDSPHHLPSALCSEHQSARCQSEQPWGAALQPPSWQRYPRGREQGCVCGTSSAALGANLARGAGAGLPGCWSSLVACYRGFQGYFIRLSGGLCVSARGTFPQGLLSPLWEVLQGPAAGEAPKQKSSGNN